MFGQGRTGIIHAVCICYTFGSTQISMRLISFSIGEYHYLLKPVQLLQDLVHDIERGDGFDATIMFDDRIPQ